MSFTQALKTSFGSAAIVGAAVTGENMRLSFEASQNAAEYVALAVKSVFSK